MRLEEIYRSPNYYSVCRSDRTDRLVLHVLAGGVAMYSVVVRLLPEEEARFRQEGHLDSLARDVAKNETRYADRILRPESAGEEIEIVSSA